MKLLLILTFSASSLICLSQINLLKRISEKAEGLINTEVQLSEDDIADGLREALVIGSSYSVNLASADSGFNNNELIRIPFPDEAIKIKTSLLKIGFNGEVEEFENCMNQAAETASKKALSILMDAIKNMSIVDALTILNGENNAATVYLKNNTHEFLYSEFKPIIVLSMDKVDLAKKWTPLIKKYNTIPFIKKLNPDLEDYITKKTIDGLFILIAEQEKQIRTNPEVRVTDLLIKIFK
jgi:uncharacterized protein (UPF0333 family)